LFGKRKILLFSLLLSLILHILFFSIIFLFIKADKKKKDTYKKREIYIYIPKKEAKLSENNRNKLKIPKSEKKGDKVVPSEHNSNSLIKKKIRNLTSPKKVKKLSKQVASISKKSYKMKNQRVKKKIEKDKKIKEKTELEQVKNEDKIKNTNTTENLIKNELVESNNSNKDLNNKKKKPLSIRELAGKEEIFELGKKSVSEEELKKDEDIEGYIRALTMYLNQLARRKDLYPPMAKRLRLEGSLIVQFKINRDGSVDEKSIKIIISSGYNVLDEGAIRIIKKYVPKFAEKYKKYPPRDNFIVELPITFEIIGW